MKIKFFYHSLASDWNHGNAHFLRGIVWELLSRGHEVQVFEPAGGWSYSHLLNERRGKKHLADFSSYYPGLNSRFYDPARFRPEPLVRDADLVIVHEWNEPSVVKKLGQARARFDFLLFFHDTHHRAITRREEMERYDLSQYDGVLVFGEILRKLYLKEGWTKRAWTWHEAADTRLFRPFPGRKKKEGDLVWVGNWGDEERAEELREFLLEPVKKLGLKTSIYGVRYPERALDALTKAGISYKGYLPNFRVPEVFSRYRLTVHVPRRPYVEALPGIPTIRPFEALACGIPLVCSPWQDQEQLFTPGQDYRIARSGWQMRETLRFLLEHPREASLQAAHGLHTIQSKHSCRRRVDELFSICAALGLDTRASTSLTVKTIKLP